MQDGGGEIQTCLRDGHWTLERKLTYDWFLTRCQTLREDFAQFNPDKGDLINRPM